MQNENKTIIHTGAELIDGDQPGSERLGRTA
jgi:hypothetical protein